MWNLEYFIPIPEPVISWKLCLNMIFNNNVWKINRPIWIINLAVFLFFQRKFYILQIVVVLYLWERELFWPKKNLGLFDIKCKFNEFLEEIYIYRSPGKIFWNLSFTSHFSFLIKLAIVFSKWMKLKSDT